MNTYTVSKHGPVIQTDEETQEPWLGLRMIGDYSLVLFGSQQLNFSAAELAALERIRSLEGVVRVVGLPDLHLKPRLETPSSVAIATDRSVVLNFSSPSPGCGIALAATGLEERDLVPDRLDRFFADLVSHLPPYASSRSGPVQDIRPFLLGGAPAAVEYYGLEPQTLRAVDGGGNALVWPGLESSAADMEGAIPPELVGLAAQDFGMIGRGNHFLELQVVDEVLDAQLAEAWGIQAGQALVMYHADSGRFGAFLGRLYAHRRKNTWRGRMIELRYKLPFHLSRASGVQGFLERAQDYFLPRRYTFLEAGSAAAQRALQALAVGMNYAFANRIAILNGINQALCDAWGTEIGPAALIYDQPHNTIRQEQIEGQTLWVHRHNASRALPIGHPELQNAGLPGAAQPVLLPGADRTHSYLCVAGPNTSNSLYSIDHGAGRSALRLGSPQPAAAGSGGGSTRLYGYAGAPPRQAAHIGNEGVEAVVEVLERAQLAHPVARLRPVAGLKDHPARQDCA